MDADKKNEFDREYIESIYLSYLSVNVSKSGKEKEFEKIIKGASILIIAPGKTSFCNKAEICEILGKRNMVSIAVNHEYPFSDTDYIFVSNKRRFRALNKNMHPKCIITSNIDAEDVYLRIPYKELLNNHDYVSDNGGLMLIRFLIGVKDIWIAGMDGYSTATANNYAKEKMEVHVQKEVLKLKNTGMHDVLIEYMQEVPIRFVTETILI